MTILRESGLKLQPVVLDLLARLDAVDLDGLNARARLLERRDNKYVLTTQQLCTFLDYARQHFDVLQIDGLRQFHYRTIYFDSPQFDCFHDHNKGRRKRLKVRFRSYLDHNRHFFEIKLKGRRNVTHKFRVPVDGPAPSDAGLCTTLRQFCNDTLATHYGQALDTELQPIITVDYQRITLVAKAGAERITVDNRLAFSDGENSVSLRDSKWVLEVKSENGLSETDRWLFAQGHRPVPKCSKYGMAVSLLKMPDRNNRFRPVLKRHFKHA